MVCDASIDDITLEGQNIAFKSGGELSVPFYHMVGE